MGKGLIGRCLLGRRVACLHNGSGDGVWAEYAVTSVKGGTLPLHKSVGLEQGAMSAIKPLTASAFLAVAKKNGHKSFVLTAAAGALGQMVNHLCQRAGVRVINIVHRHSQGEFLKRQGIMNVLDSSEDDFVQQLRDVCVQHGTTLAFDAVAGPLTGQLLEALPFQGKVTVFGGLSNQPAQASPGKLIFDNKIVDGFWLGPWMAKKNIMQIMLLWRRAQKLIPTELKSEIRGRYPFHKAKEAIMDYRSQMTGGKILLCAK